MNVKPGDTVLFIYKNKKHYRKINSITATSDGIMAKFDPGCACKAMLVPINEVFKDSNEFKEYAKKKGMM